MAFFFIIEEKVYNRVSHAMMGSCINSPSKRQRGGNNVVSESEAIASHVPVTQSKPDTTSLSSKVCFGAGCYWGTEHYIRNKFGKANKGSIVSGLVGFMVLISIFLCRAALLRPRIVSFLYVRRGLQAVKRILHTKKFVQDEPATLKFSI